MSENKSREQKLAELDEILTGESRFFYDYRPQIETYLDDEDAEVRATAVRCLWEYPLPEYIDLLKEMADTDPSDEVRQAALSGLGIYVYSAEEALFDAGWDQYDEVMQAFEQAEEDLDRVYTYLLDVVEDEDRPLDERRRAIEAISFSSEPEVRDILENAYQHPETNVKVSALFGMGRNGHQRWGPYVREALESSIPEIKLEAVRAAGELGLETANDRLMHIASRADDKDLRIEAIWSLGQIGHEAAFPLLEDLQSDPDADIREVAEAALDEWLMMAEMGDDAFPDEDEFGGILGNGDIAHD